MSFTEAIGHVLSNYANFSGRARRSEYWWFFLFSFLGNAILSALNNAAKGSHFSWVFAALTAIFSLGLFIPSLALNWRRMHDIGKSGAWMFIILIPLVGPILYLIWCCTDSQSGTNQYGPNPKAAGPGVPF